MFLYDIFLVFFIFLYDIFLCQIFFYMIFFFVKYFFIWYFSLSNIFLHYFFPTVIWQVNCYRSSFPLYKLPAFPDTSIKTTINTGRIYYTENEVNPPLQPPSPTIVPSHTTRFPTLFPLSNYILYYYYPSLYLKQCIFHDANKSNPHCKPRLITF